MVKLILFLLALSSWASAGEIIGKAYSAGKLIYIEKHKAVVAPTGSYLKLETEYYYPNNEKFAEVKSDFSKNPFVPDVEFKDSRFKLTELVKVSGNPLAIEIDRQLSDKKSRSSLKLHSDSILGQGFHNYIVSNFDKILQDKIDVHFVITSKSDQYKFHISKKESDNKSVVFKVVPANFFLRQIVSPIILRYSLDKRQLLSFNGLSNLDNDKGQSQKVEIIYEEK